MIRLIKTQWQTINEPEDRPDKLEVVGFPLCRLFYKYYWMPHHWAVLLTVTLASITGLHMFGYAAASKFIADDIVEIGLMEQQPSAPYTLDPTLPGETQLFAFDEPRLERSMIEVLDERPGKSVKQKMILLGYLAVALVMMEVLRHLIDGVVLERTVYLTQKTQFRLRQQIHDKLHALPMHYHDRHSPGWLMTHLFSDMTVIQNSITQLMRTVPPSVITILVGSVIVVAIDRVMGTLLLATLPLYAVCYRWFSSRLRRVSRNLRESEGRLNAHIANRVGNFQLVKAFSREKRESIEFLRKARPVLRRTMASDLLNTGFVVASGILSTGSMTLMLWIGALRVREGQLSVGQLLMFYSSGAYLFTPVAQLTSLAGILHRLRAVAGKVMRVLDEPVTLSDPIVAVPLPGKACTLEFRDVSLTYEGAPQPALQDVNFRLPAGGRLCVMGPSGSGKSTLSKLAARLYDPQQGAVLFDGVDVRDFRINDFRKYVGFVSQEPLVFSGTIADNIRYGSEQADHRHVVAAASFARIHDFVERLPERYQTPTHERGLTLSGGQKQRVNLARALLYDARVLVLDDCTSALDAQTESELVESFREVLQDRTSILITHRVSLAMECDAVLMLDQGRVVEYGTPEQLLHQGGAFATVYREQVEKPQSDQSDQSDPTGHLSGAVS